jgi:RNA polymerase sigma factor (sigma-70 family)
VTRVICRRVAESVIRIFVEREESDLDKAQWIEILIQRHSKGLIRYASNILKDKEAAKEIVQEGFLKLLQHKDEVPEEHVQAWLFRECRNRSIDSWRKLRRIDRLDDKTEEALGFSTSNPLQDLETHRELREMNVAIAKLSARHREALFLKYKDGLSYKQIAEVMGLTSTNVGFILHEAMTELRAGTLEAEAGAAKRKYGE